jgi:hypothetical protein
LADYAGQSLRKARNPSEGKQGTDQHLNISELFSILSFDVWKHRERSPYSSTEFLVPPQ